jgi:HlyD family secretion protein
MKPVPVFSFAGLALILAAGSIVRNIPLSDRSEPLKLAPISPFEDTVAATGIIEANSENISLGSPVSGLVERVSVKAGQEVREGEELFVVDTRTLKTARDQRLAEVNVAKSEVLLARSLLKESEAKMRFVQNLPDKRAVSDEERTLRALAFQTAESRVTNAEAKLAQADAALRNAEVELSKASVCAPITGTILNVDIRPGEYISGATNSYILMGNIKPLYVRVDVDEEQAAALKQNSEGLALLRGEAKIRTNLAFVREEPYVKPKHSLTGDSKERVDTRVLQLIYRIDDSSFPGRVGQQLDVFLHGALAPGEQTVKAQVVSPVKN